MPYLRTDVRSIGTPCRTAAVVTVQSACAQTEPAEGQRSATHPTALPGPLAGGPVVADVPFCIVVQVESEPVPGILLA